MRPGGEFGRLAEPKEIAELVVFLTSPRSSCMMGGTAVIGRLSLDQLSGTMSTVDPAGIIGPGQQSGQRPECLQEAGSMPDLPAMGSRGSPSRTACQSKKYRVTIFPHGSRLPGHVDRGRRLHLRAMVAATSLGRVSLMATVDLLVGIAPRTACLSSANVLAPLITISNGSAGLAHLLEPEWQSVRPR